jgi:hypothetical protein
VFEGFSITRAKARIAVYRKFAMRSALVERARRTGPFSVTTKQTGSALIYILVSGAARRPVSRLLSTRSRYGRLLPDRLLH